MNEQEHLILAAIESNPLASQQQLAEQLGLSRESIAGYISRLTRKGAILGKGYILPRAESIVVIGGANVDLAGTSNDEYQPGDSNPGQVRQSAGGVGRNIAENLARLGNDVSMISLVGQDSRGRFLLEQAALAGIQIQDMDQLASHATSTYLALHAREGELVGSIADMAIMTQLTPTFLETKQPRLLSASKIVIDANVPAATIEWLAEQPFTAALIADAVSATKAVHLIPLLSRLDTLKVNRAEALAILEIPHDQSLSDTDIIAALKKRGVKHVLLSLSEEGVMVGAPEQTLKQGVPSCNMVSDTGGGDALLAGFVHAKGQFERTEDHIKFALACAATTLEAREAVNPQLTEAYVTQRFTQFLNQTTDAVLTTSETL